MANTSFTPQEIEQFLQQFFDVVGARQYIGARYVPIFGRAGSDTVAWDDLAPYEPLTVVMHDGVSYVSRRYVPAGVDITETDYWVQTYRFNAQVEQYRQEVLAMQGDVDNRVPFPNPIYYPKLGTLGQVLTTLADGSTKWENPVVPSDAQAEEVITAWLDDHPEATTTVQDGSITNVKLHDDTIADAKLLQDGGILARTNAMNLGLSTSIHDEYAIHGTYSIPDNNYLFNTIRAVCYLRRVTDDNRHLKFHYPSTLRWSGYQILVNGTWQTSGIVITNNETTLPDNAEQFRITFQNASSASTAITQAELEATYLEIVNTLQDGSITNAMIHDDTIADAKLLQDGGILARTNAMNLGLSTSIHDEYAIHGTYLLPDDSYQFNTVRAVCYLRRVTDGNRHIRFHYPNTLRWSGYQIYINGAWQTSGIVISNNETTLPDGVEQLRVIFQNTSSASTAITQAELEATYLEIVNSVDDAIESIDARVDGIEEGIHYATAPMEYGGFGVNDGQLSFVYNTIRARTKVMYVSNFSSRVKIEVPSTIVPNNGARMVGGQWQIVNIATSARIIDFGDDTEALIVGFKNATDSYANISEQELSQIKVISATNPLFGLTYAALGDSITYGFIPRNYTGYPGQLDSYAKLTAEYLGMNFVNYGISGNTLAALEGVNNPMCVRYADMTGNADLITFMGGTNDIRNGVPLGTFEDRVTSTYYGALHTLMAGLYKKYMIDQGTTKGKKKRIVALTPIKLLQSSASTQGGTGTLRDMSQWVEAVKRVADYYSIPVFDMYNLSGINPHLNETVQGTEQGYTGFYNPYITDGTHPTQEGAYIMAQKLIGFLNTI